MLGCHLKGGVIHRVEKGECLSSIAHVYGVPLKELMRANPRIRGDLLHPGQKLLVPGAKKIESSVPQVFTVKEKKKSRAKTTRSASPTFDWPVDAPVISTFGMRNRKMHNGIDLRVPPNGEIKAVADGKVVHVGSDVEGYGRLVILRHATNLFSVYAYLGEILVKKGAEVQRGSAVARAGSKSSDSFIHFELRRGKRALDPLSILPKRK